MKVVIYKWYVLEQRFFAQVENSLINQFISFVYWSNWKNKIDKYVDCSVAIVDITTKNDGNSPLTTLTWTPWGR